MKVLWLSDIGIGVQQAMPNALQTLCLGKWPKLQVLDLSYNKLRAGCAEVLVQAEWPELTTLNLNSNNFSEETHAHIRACMKQFWPRVKVFVHPGE